MRASATIGWGYLSVVAGRLVVLGLVSFAPVTGKGSRTPLARARASVSYA